MKTMLVSVSALLSGVASAQPSNTLLPTFTPQGVSADGRVVVGAEGASAAYWTRQGGIVHMTTPLVTGVATSLAVAASRDGSVITGCGLNQHGIILLSWVWTPQGATVVEVPGMTNTRATCISQDGITVGGIAIPVPPTGGYRSFVWTAADGSRIIPGGSNYQTWLHGLSADGLKGAGSGSSQIGTWPTYWGSTYVWCQNNGPVTGQTNGVAQGISGDGSTLVGQFNASTNGPGFVWRAEDGYTFLGAGTMLETASYDGRIAGGGSGGAGVIWTRGAGSSPAAAYFAARGVSGVSVIEIVGISANGRVFVGRTSGYPLGAAIIDLGSCGAADFNHDGSSGTDADIEAFFRCLAGDCCPRCDSADFNYDGDAATDADIEAFFRVLAGGSC